MITDLYRRSLVRDAPADVEAAANNTSKNPTNLKGKATTSPFHNFSLNATENYSYTSIEMKDMDSQQ